MKIILGLNIYHADASACIIKNGNLLFAIEEERVNRIKHWAGLPINAINECLKYTGIEINEITDVAINTSPLSAVDSELEHEYKNVHELPSWVQSKIAVLMTIQDALLPVEVEGVGRRISDVTYWIYSDES